MGAPDGILSYAAIAKAPPCSVCAGVVLPYDRPINEVLNCAGYFGFGGGYARALGRSFPDGQLYCNVCPEGPACWEAHRRRTAEVSPQLVAAFEAFVKKHGPGPDTLRRFLQVQAAEGIERPVEPYTTVLSGNVEDGMAVALIGEPRRRVLPGGKDVTVPWPFPAKARTQA